MSNRYKPVGNWRRHDQDRWRYWRYADDRVQIDISDVREDDGGTIWHDGAHRVTITGKIPGRPRSKTFIGEVAWCNAERYANDALIWFQHRREEDYA